MISLSLLVGCALLVGCGADHGSKQTVTGTITLGGQPLDQGSIQFSPKAGSSGNMSGAEIKNGTYNIALETGLDPGVYEVRIFSAGASAAPEEALPGESGPAAQDRIPAEFNAQTTLEFTVAEGQPNQFDVDIP